MLRKTTAVMFMLVMALLITLKHPVLGYCLCLDSYFTGDCVCQVEKPQTVSDAKEPAAPCPNCASCEAEINTNQNSPVKPVPCDDCTEHLNIDVGDFVWQSTDQVPDNAEMLIPFPDYLAATTVQIPSISVGTTMQIRGSPPFRWQNIPIYLRHSVLIL
jgi:hypothetical protein